MSLSSWKQFQFYENIPIRDPLLGSASQLYSDPTLSAATLIDNDTLIIAVNSTTIKVVEIINSSVTHSFKAFDEGYRITYLQVINKSFLIAVAENTGFPCHLKLYNLNKLPTNEKSFLTLVELKNGNNTYPISAISISNDLLCLVVGFINGKLLLVRGDLARDRGSKQRFIYTDSDNEPITSLALNQDTTMCFSSTTTKILLFNTTGRNNGKPDVVLNSGSGVNLNCGCLSKKSDEFVCYQNGLIEFYKLNGERSTIPFEMSVVKRLFPLDRTHILLIVEEDTSQNTSLEVNDIASTVSRVVIIDTKKKVISLNFIISNSVIDILSSKQDINSSIFLLTSNGVIHKILEKSLQEKLDIILQKQLFLFALEIANENKLADLAIQEIHRQYGDYLYNKGQRTEATEHYIQCLDIVETSEVISKFSVEETSDQRGIRNLADYLWSLVKKGIATADHVTLLLIVLIKLKAKDDINNFLTHFTRLGVYSETPVETDIDDETYFYSNKELFNFKLILNLLEDSHFDIETYELAKKFSKDAVTIVEVLLDTLNDPLVALRYIKSLPIDDTLRVLAIFSKSLLETLPNDTNALLIEVFTGKYTPITYTSKIKEKKETEISEDLKKIFYSYTSFVGYMNPTLNSKLHSDLESETKQNPTYHPPKPSIVFSSFISKPFQFVVFLEACLDSYQRYEGLAEDKQVILTTLYNLYLTLANDDISERQHDWKLKASKTMRESDRLVRNDDSKSVTTNNKMIDNSLMMLISHMNKVDMFMSYNEKEQDGDQSIDNSNENNNLKGTLDNAYEASLINNFRSLTLTEEVSSCMNFFEKYRDIDPNLYRVALTYFSSSNNILNEIGGESALKQKVLDTIIEKNLLPMMDVLQILASTNTVTYGLIQDILIKQIQENEEEMTKNEKLVSSYEKELEEKKSKLNELLRDSDGTNIQLKGKLCYMCETPIELPLVYFKCGHIYHQRCLNEEDFNNTNVQIFKCPKCVVEFETSNKLYETQQNLSEKYELLKMTLDNENENSNRFKTITEFIGKGGLEYDHIVI